MKLFRKKRLRHGVCLSQETRSLKRTHLASLSGSCSQLDCYRMLVHLMPDSLSLFVLVRWLILKKSIILCLASNWLCCVIFEIMLGKVLVVWARLPKCKVTFFFFLVKDEIDSTSRFGKKFYHINCGVKQGFPALRKAVRTRYEIFSPVLI